MASVGSKKHRHHNRHDKTLADLKKLIDELSILREDMAGLESAFFAELRDIHKDYMVSARNLVHYLALRRHDIRDLQKDWHYLAYHLWDVPNRTPWRPSIPSSPFFAD